MCFALITSFSFRRAVSNLHAFENHYRATALAQLRARSTPQRSQRMSAILSAKKTSVAMRYLDNAENEFMGDNASAVTPGSGSNNVRSAKRSFSFDMFPDGVAVGSTSKRQSIDEGVSESAFAGHTPTMAERSELGDYVPLPAYGFVEGHGSLTPSMSAKTRLMLHARRNSVTKMPVADAIARSPELIALNLDTFHTVQTEGIRCLPRRMRRRLSTLSAYSAFQDLPGDEDADAAALDRSGNFELFKVNLDNFESSKRCLDRIEARLSRQSLSFWNDFGFGVDLNGEPSSVHEGGRGLDRFRARRTASSRSSDRRGASRDTGNGMRRSTRNVRQDDGSESSDAAGDSDSSYMSDVDDPLAPEELARFCKELEAPETTLQKEQELEIFLLGFGPTTFVDPTDPLGVAEVNPTKLTMSQLLPMVNVQEQQLKALRQRHNELSAAYQAVRRDMRDTKRCKKFGVFMGAGRIDDKMVCVDAADVSDATPVCGTPVEPMDVEVLAQASSSVETAMTGMLSGKLSSAESTWSAESSSMGLAGDKNVKVTGQLHLPTPSSSTIFTAPHLRQGQGE